jgi:hypothetical protein
MFRISKAFLIDKKGILNIANMVNADHGIEKRVNFLLPD